MVFIKRNKFIVLLLWAVFILRLPSLFEPYWYGDEGIYLTIGMTIRKGFLLYRDVFDNKPPLIYLLAAIANGRQFWLRFFLSVSVLTSIYFFYQLSLLLFAGQSKKAKIATLLFAFFTTARTFEGNIANAELFILAPVISAFYLYFRPKVEKKGFATRFWTRFWIGFLLSCGFLFKAPAVFDFLTLFVFIIFFSAKKAYLLASKVSSLCFGYLTPILMTGVFFWFKSSFSFFFNSVFVQTIGYLSSWKTGSHIFSLISLLRSELLFKTFLAFILVFLLWLKRKLLPDKLIFVSLWFIFSLFAATLSGRPYPHYLIQIVPSFSFLLTIFFNRRNRLFFFPILALSLFLTSFIHYRFWRYTTVPYYQNFLSFALAKKNQPAYYSFFNLYLNRIYETAEFITANSNPEDKIFVWANEPVLYTLSRRLPATPYLVAYHINDLKHHLAVIEKINQNRPVIIVTTKNAGPFPLLGITLTEDYLQIENIGDFTIYRRRLNNNF